MRNLVVILGDQLDLQSSAFDGFDHSVDVVWMAELSGESEHVWSHKSRIVLFLSAMRHFAATLEDQAFPLRYLQLGRHRFSNFAEALKDEIASNRPQRLVVVEPGEHRVLVQLRGEAKRNRLPIDVRPDRHFLLDLNSFDQWAEGRRQLRLKHFYRHMRQRTGVLMDNNRPIGGSWNFDKENRKCLRPSYGCART